DTLYEPSLVRQWYAAKTEGTARGPADAAVRWYVRRHLRRLLEAPAERPPATGSPERRGPTDEKVRRAARLLANSERPVLLVGSQALTAPTEAAGLVEAVRSLGLPVYLSGMARG